MMVLLSVVPVVVEGVSIASSRYAPKTSSSSSHSTGKRLQDADSTPAPEGCQRSVGIGGDRG
jgi:hypothetical protein